jgi:hypothetical protein
MIATPAKGLAAALFTLMLAGCASTPPPPPEPPAHWVGGDPQKLAGDRAVCHDEAANLDTNQANGYTDPRYGMATAMAHSLGRDNPLSDQTKTMRAAAFNACMNDKGWKNDETALAPAKP